jgi:hypothetical protein
MQLSPAQFTLALFLHEVLRSETAWSFCNDRELCVVHTPAEVVLVLCSSLRVARHVQRRVRHPLRITSLSVDELLGCCLPTAREAALSIGVCVLEDEDIVTVPAAWIEKALRECRKPRGG